MSENQITENEMLKKLNMLLEKQTIIEQETSELRVEIENIKQLVSIPVKELTQVYEAVTVEKAEPLVEESLPVTPKMHQVNTPDNKSIKPDPAYLSFSEKQQAYYAALNKEKAHRSSEIEKFIGENLINKIGILITIIGVAIGAKYAIDHQLISPLTRILLSYLVGFVLLGFAIRLTKEYQNFSAVLMSGAMAIFYFITYAAYSFYALMPQYVAFTLMVLITVFTVYAAIKYDRQVIAHIGMVGAYGVPFLLSDGSGRIVILFSYMSIINLGIMVLAFKKYWKPIYYFSFVLSWIIYLAWYATSYKDLDHFYQAFLFLTVFYLIFYVTYLSYNLIRKEKFILWDILLIMANSFMFYGIGYALLNQHPQGEQYLGLFTVVTALIHTLVCGLIYKMKLAEWHLFYFISALAVTFFTIAVPVQLSGSWITLLWVGEAGILFWIGQIKQISIYEQLSLGLMVLAMFSILGVWDKGYSDIHILKMHLYITPIANIYFITSLLFVMVFAFINLVNRKAGCPSTIKTKGLLYKTLQLLIPGFLLIVLYFMFWFEIKAYCNQLIAEIGGVYRGTVENELNLKHYLDLTQFKIVWLINYSLFFFVVLSMVNIKFLKNRLLGYVNLEANLIVLVLFLTQGLFSLSELRDSFLNQLATDIYHPGAFNFNFRYVSYLFVLPMLIFSHQYVRQDFIDIKLDKAYSLIMHTVALWILSSELITWIDFAKGDQSYKLGLSLLWGGYALMLIILGIWKKQQQLRIGAIILFSATLLKLFFYDLRDMGTIARTIVFVTLGILLLVISFLYNKYKQVIWDDANE
ncbi:MAG: DUF2339 domain-containing protein [Bacteroidetes bacterium]|nr:DUF2339 domain-containing protein [Bacteroidota bacterium]